MLTYRKVTTMGVLVERDEVASHSSPTLGHWYDLMREQGISARLLDERSVQLFRGELHHR